MANETIKALLMIVMFGVLELALYFPRIRAMTHAMKRSAREALAQLSPAEMPAKYALQPVRAKRHSRKP
jgi:Flp pilus assembly protein TadG